MLEKIKILLYPTRLIWKEYYANILLGLYDGFQSIFVIQILANIVKAIQYKNVHDFNKWILIFAIIQLSLYITIYFGYHAFSYAYPKLKYTLSHIYLERYLRLDNNRIETLGTGRSNSILTSGIENWCNILLENFTDLSVNIFSTIYAFWVIYHTAGASFFIVVALLFTMIFIWSYYFTSISMKLRSKRKEEEVIFDRNFIKVIMSKFEILQNNKFRQESDRLGSLTSVIQKLWWKEDNRGVAGSIGVKLIVSLLLFSVFLYIGKGVISGRFEMSYFILIYGMVDVLERYSWNTTHQIRTIGIKLINIDKLLEMFNDIPEVPGLSKTKEFEFINGDIELKDIKLHYGNHKVFDSFSVQIKGGKKTALVGNSGSGKTTLMKILSGYLYPTSGKINIDGQDLSSVNLLSYYKHIGYLSQDPSVFDGTIEENLLYALDHKPSEEKIKEIIISSRCEFIYELPDGLLTEIGERGIKLSGGQKQRLAIAKIMLKNPDIILLDEPTSALDSISEQAVNEALRNLFEGKTVIVIAHRLQTVKEAHDIIVLKDGMITERGDHQTLSNFDGEYKRMLDLQTSF